MGTFKWRISTMDGRQSQDIEAVVGAGTFCTHVARWPVAQPGNRAEGQMQGPQAGGRGIDLDYGQAWVSIDGKSEITQVVFGEDDSPALLGTYTLDGLALAVPIEQRLVPKTLILY